MRQDGHGMMVNDGLWPADSSAVRINPSAAGEHLADAEALPVDFESLPTYKNKTQISH